MTVKTNGAEMKRFFADRTFWPKDTYHENEELVVDGDIWDFGSDSEMETIPNHAVVTIEGGIVFMDSDAERVAMSAAGRKV